MAARRRPKKQFVYEGPVGRCPCCDRPTEVRIASMTGEPDIVGWVVDEEVLRTIYQAIGAQIRDETRKGKTHYYITDPNTYDATRRQKLYFVEGATGEVAGPFGPFGLKAFMHSVMESARLAEISIYVVGTTSRALSVIRKSPFASEPDEVDDQVEPSGEDLF